MKAPMELLIFNIVRLLMPRECFIWFRSKFPGLTMLLSLALGIPLIFWIFLALSLVGYNPVDQRDAIFCATFVIVPPLALILIKVLLWRFWKPTPAMLAHNEALMQKELKQMAQETSKTDEVKQNQDDLTGDAGDASGAADPVPAQTDAKQAGAETLLPERPVAEVDWAGQVDVTPFGDQPGFSARPGGKWEI